MPFISDSELALVKRNMVTQENRLAKAREKIEQSAVVNKVLTLGEGIGGGFAIGFLRGKMEDKATGQWNIPGTTVDIEALAVAGLSGLAVAGEAVGLSSKHTRHLAAIAAGVGGHYAGQIARKLAATGQFSMVAGVGALPPYDPTSYDPTQFSSPYADPSASALASSGI